MSKEVIRQALEALEAGEYYIDDLEAIVYAADDLGTHEDRAKMQAAITVLREALAKPDFWEGYVPEPTMYLESGGLGYGPAPERKLIIGYVNKSEQPVKPATEQSSAEQPAQQEPEYAWPTVADYENDVGFEVNQAFKMGWDMARTTNGFLNHLAGVTPQPAQRTWVGLTDEERDDLLDRYITAEGRARAIEAKLKEKNT